MFDFDDVRLATKDEQIRAYAVERAIDTLGSGGPAHRVLPLAKQIEAYIKTGSVDDD